MVSAFESRWSQFVLLGQFGLLASAFSSEKPLVWISTAGIIALISLVSWVSSVRQAKLIADTPTSSIASAAQGYVELKGVASPKPEYLVVGRSGLPCVWFRCVSYRKDGRDNEWREVERTCSDSIFELNDNSGVPCMVDPERAKVLTSNSRTWYSNEYKHVEEQLFPGQPLYVLGEFSTLNPNSGQAEINTEVSLLLAEWKKNRAGLLERFDSNGDGKIDMHEWEQARQAAYHQIGQQNRDMVKQPGIHMISRPKDGRLFLLSNLPEQKLRRLSLIWAWVHLSVFFAGLSAGLILAAKHGLFHLMPH